MPTRVLFLSPGYPAEMPFFCRGLADVGARVYGIGDQPQAALPAMARNALSGYLQVSDLWNETSTTKTVSQWVGSFGGVDRVEVLWEPGMILAGRLREALGCPGLDVERSIPFRDKERMKQVLDRAGLRTPRHRRARTEDEVRAAAEEIGWPLIVKPIAGAGSQDTFRCDAPADLEAALGKIRHVAEVSVEEYVDGEEYTFETICSGGRVLMESSMWYRPKPLIARQNEWISPQTIGLRDLSVPALQPGYALGRKVLKALGFEDGFTHMEWYLTSKGEAVFGEIGGRPPGARSVDIVNFVCDADMFRGWAEAILLGRLEQPTTRKYNVGHVCKRASGQGTIRRIDGLERLRRDLGPALVAEELLPVGAHRRDWRQTLLSDGFLIVRHPDLRTLLGLADRIGTDLALHAS